MFQVPTGPLSSDTAAKLNEELKRLRKDSRTIEDYRGGNYTDNIVPNNAFPVKLTAYSSTHKFYTWKEQIATAFGYAGWADLPGGRSGTATLNPAYEPNDVLIDVTSSPVVWIGRAYYDATFDWVYVIVGETGGAGTAKLRGTLAGTLNFGSTATMNIVGGGTVTVNDWLLSSGQSVASGKQVTAFLDANGNWYVDGAQCP